MEIPSFLKEKLKTQYREEITQKIIKGYMAKRKTTLRVNTLKTSSTNVIDILDKNNIKFKKVNWYNDAFIIENANESDIQKLDIYQNGEIYLQSLSSMLPPLILNPQEKTDILDMAAAPGGKTTQIAAIVNNNASITACELNKIRAEKLKYNIEKQGAKAYVMVTDARKIDSFFSFDKILLDAPCSGSGTLDLNTGISEKNFSLNLISKSVKAQTALLEKALKILKPGCDMVYSTCSILQEENEEILEKVLSKNKAKIVPIDFELKDLPLLPSKIPGTLCVLPNDLYEGFFIAKIQK
ncbi:MAG: RsmB/NOP family class I SAM-dependent RNA methyltransferase [Clostridia bacterium]